MLQLLDCQTLDAESHQLLFRALLKLSKRSGLYPSCLLLPGGCMKNSDPIATGSFGDVWRTNVYGQVVAIKTARACQRGELEKITQVIEA